MRVMIYGLRGLVAIALGLALFWYVQTRNVEIARYQVIETDGDIEIRDYPALAVAEVTRTGSRDAAVRAGSGRSPAISSPANGRARRSP